MQGGKHIELDTKMNNLWVWKWLDKIINNLIQNKNMLKN